MSDLLIFRCCKCRTELEITPGPEQTMACCPFCEVSLMLPMPDIKPGRKVAEFELEEKLGVGSIGETWLANNVTDNITHVLKILSPAITTIPKDLVFIEKEAELASSLKHPNISVPEGYGNEAAVHFIKFPFVNGISLQERINANNNFSEKEALETIRQIADALNYAYRKNKIIHHNIKPSNILFDTKGKAVLLDLGTTKTLYNEPYYHEKGFITGTPFYMSPEQACMEKDVQAKTDIYSLGIILFKMLTGKHPFKGQNYMSILAMHITNELPDPQGISSGISDNASKLLKVMLAKRKEDRQKDLKGLISDIDLVLRGKAPSIKPPDAAKSIIQINPQEVLYRRKVLDKPPKAEYHGEKPMIDSNISATNLHSIDTIIAPVPKKKSATPIIAAILVVGILFSAIVAFIVYREYQAFEKQQERNRLKKQQEIRLAAMRKKTLLKKKKAEEILRKEQEKYWQNIISYVNSNKYEFDKIISKLEEAKVKLKKTKYVEIAQQKIEKIKNDRDELEKQLVAEKARKLAEEKRLADLKLKRELELKKKREQEAIKLKRAKSISEIAQDLVEMNFKAALIKLRKSDYKEVKYLGKIIRPLLLSEKLILLSFEKDIGKEIKIVIDGTEHTCKITGIMNRIVYSRERIRKVYLKKSFSVRELSVAERLKRLSRINPTSRTLYAGLSYLKEKDIDKAEEYFKETGELSVPLLSEVEKIRTAQLENKAKTQLTKILNDFGLKGSFKNYIDIDAICELIDGKIITKEQAETTKKALSKYDEEFKNTQFYKNTNNIFKELNTVINRTVSSAPEPKVEGK